MASVLLLGQQYGTHFTYGRGCPTPMHDLCRLAASGLDVAQEVSKRSLVQSSDQNHLVNGRFDSRLRIADYAPGPRRQAGSRRD